MLAVSNWYIEKPKMTILIQNCVMKITNRLSIVRQQLFHVLLFFCKSFSILTARSMWSKSLLLTRDSLLGLCISSPNPVSISVWHWFICETLPGYISKQHKLFLNFLLFRFSLRPFDIWIVKSIMFIIKYLYRSYS